MENRDVVAYDCRIVTHPFVQLKQWEFPQDPVEIWNTLEIVTCRVVTRMTDGSLDLAALDTGMRFRLKADGMIDVVDPGKEAAERIEILTSRPLGLRWQGDVPSALLDDCIGLNSYINNWEVGHRCFPRIEDFRIPVFRAFLNSMADQLEALLPLLEKKPEADPGHVAAVRSMIEQTREMTHSRA